MKVSLSGSGSSETKVDSDKTTKDDVSDPSKAQENQASSGSEPIKSAWGNSQVSE